MADDYGNCPLCGIALKEDDDYVDLYKDGKILEFHEKCAINVLDRGHGEIEDARKYAKACNQRASDPLLVIATIMDLDKTIGCSQYRCPCCSIHIGPTDGYDVLLDDLDSGDEMHCGVCGLTIPMLPTIIWNKWGSLYK